MIERAKLSWNRWSMKLKIWNVTYYLYMATLFSLQDESRLVVSSGRRWLERLVSVVQVELPLDVREQDVGHEENLRRSENL